MFFLPPHTRLPSFLFSPPPLFSFLSIRKRERKTNEQHLQRSHKKALKKRGARGVYTSYSIPAIPSPAHPSLGMGNRLPSRVTQCTSLLPLLLPPSLLSPSFSSSGLSSSLLLSSPSFSSSSANEMWRPASETRVGLRRVQFQTAPWLRGSSAYRVHRVCCSHSQLDTAQTPRLSHIWRCRVRNPWVM